MRTLVIASGLTQNLPILFNSYLHNLHHKKLILPATKYDLKHDVSWVGSVCEKKMENPGNKDFFSSPHQTFHLLVSWFFYGDLFIAVTDYILKNA